MKVLNNTDRNVDTDADQVTALQSELTSVFAKFERQLTRIEMHLRDESAGRETSDDIRCLLEARPTGLEPVAASHHASTVEEAVSGATDKLDALLTTVFERRTDRAQARDTIRRP